MTVLSIKNGYTTLPLSRSQCADLAQICCCASQEGLAPELTDWRTLTTLFHYCASAGPPTYADPTRSPTPLLPPRLTYITYQVIEQAGQPKERIILALSAHQCADLTKACQFAAPYNPTGRPDACQILAGLFEACAIAGFAQWQMGAAELAALEAQLRLLGLGGDEVIGDEGIGD